MSVISCNRIKTHDGARKLKQETILMDSIKKLDSLSDLNWINNDSLSIVYAKGALKLGHSLSSEEPLIKAYHAIGKAYYSRHKDSSFYYYSKALALSDKLKSVTEKPSLLYNIAMLNEDAGNLRVSLALLDSSASCARRTRNFTVLSEAYNSMGNIYMEIHDTASAIRWFNNALQVGNEHSLSRQIADAMGNLALFESDKNKAILLQKQAISYLQKTPGTEGEIAEVNVCIGDEQIKPDTAIIYYYRGLEGTESGNYPEIVFTAYNNLVYSYLDLGNIKKATECLVDKAIPLAKKMNHKDWLATAYDTYADVFSAKGDPKNAFLSLRKSINYQKQFNVKNNEKQLRLLGAILDLNTKETIIREKETEIKTQHLQNKFLKLVLAIAFLVIIIIIFVYMGFRQQMKIKFKQQQITSAKRIIELEETEKSRIGFELHDNLGYLARVTDGFINSLTITDTDAKQQLTDKMRELSDCIRRISHRINLLKEEQSRLEEVIPAIINDIRIFTGINVSYFIPDHLPDIPREILLHTCRIVQELLTNAGKYAGNSKITIDLALTGKKLLLLYKDDGPGFDPSGITGKGIGLSSIYERIKLLGGKAELDSSPGRGTKWEISIPLQS
jgi:signal transduction histidine kinase